jgi:hypothetical protein
VRRRAGFLRPSPACEPSSTPAPNSTRAPPPPQVALRLNLCAVLTGQDRGADAAEVLRELRHKLPSNPKARTQCTREGGLGG